MVDKVSPFRPGTPASPDLFVGRREQIKEITRYIDQSASGRQENLFLIGDRGIGKSSLAAYLMNYAKKANKMVGIHLFLDGTDDVNGVVKKIIEALLNEVSEEKWYDKVGNIFSKYVETIGIAGLNIKFKPPVEDLQVITNEFPKILVKVLNEIKNEKNGLFIILDDINGLTDDPTFADWYKSFVDTVGTKYVDIKFPVFLMLVGLPEKREALLSHNESFMRMFHVTEINRLSDEEVKQFITSTFDQIGYDIEIRAKDLIVYYSSGLPTMMHEIGDSTFWLDDDEIINEMDAVKGITDAGNNIGKKYIKPAVLGAIRSEKYRSILNKLGDDLLFEFNKKEVEGKLSGPEKRVFSDFLVRCRELGIIDFKEVRGTGEYKFVNNLYTVYFMIQAGLNKDDQKTLV